MQILWAVGWTINKLHFSLSLRLNCTFETIFILLFLCCKKFSFKCWKWFFRADDCDEGERIIDYSMLLSITHESISSPSNAYSHDTCRHTYKTTHNVRGNSIRHFEEIKVLELIYGPLYLDEQKWIIECVCVCVFMTLIWDRLYLTSSSQNCVKILCDMEN